jgi:hypothetical protein
VWTSLKTALIMELFVSLPSLEALEFREKYSVGDREVLEYLIEK